MSKTDSHSSHKKEYLVIFFVLAVLTIIELIIPGLKNVTSILKTTSLISLAIAKAFLVAYSYMHLRSESGWLKFIAAIPCSVAIFTIVVVLDSLYR